MIYDEYIEALNKYHISCFGKTHVTRIDSDQLTDFVLWRVSQLCRIRPPSTIQNHNSALQMVSDYAVKKKWMLVVQVPKLENDGAGSQRLAALNIDEYLKVLQKVEELMRERRRGKSQQIRELLLDYMDFAILTGMRPGSGMDNLTWEDLHIERDAERCRFYVTVRKGKTTKYTGTREIVCKEAILKVLQPLAIVFRTARGMNVSFDYLMVPQSKKCHEILIKPLN